MPELIGRWPVVVSALCALVVAAAGKPAQAAGSADSGSINGPIVSGWVNGIATSGATTYLGGRFDYIGAYTGGGVLIDPSADGRAGAVTPVAPIDGTVHAVVGDGRGGWYAGGSFSRVGDVERANLVRITATGEVDLDWVADADGTVLALALSPDRSTLYVGGDFTTIAGAARQRVAALDTGTATVAPWNPGADAAVQTIVLDSGTAYLGGSFSHVNGKTRTRLAIVDADDGTVDACSPDPDGEVHDVSIDGDIAYVAGGFSRIGGLSAPYLATYDLRHCRVTPEGTAWVPTVDGAVYDLERDGRRLILAGAFDYVESRMRASIAAVQLDSHAIENWNPGADRSVEQVAIDGDTVYAAGAFDTIAGARRRRIAALDRATGAVRPMDVKLSHGVLALAVQNATLFAGGRFASAGGVERSNLAAVDAAGHITDWAPSTNDTVNELVTDGETVWAGGAFTRVNATGRGGLAAITADGGQLVTRFWPGLGSVSALALSRDGSTIYAGGSFTRAGTQNRINLAAFDVAGTGEPTAWNPSPNRPVRALALAPDGSTLYVGGEFASIGGRTRGGLAAFRVPSGEQIVTDISISANPTVNALVATDDAVYVGGRFTWLAGTDRTNLAALTPDLQSLHAWQPEPDGNVEALDVSATTVRVVGSFDQLGGAPRAGIGAVDRRSGAVTAWAPATVGNFHTLVGDGATLHLGGWFWDSHSVDRGYAAFALRAVIAPTPNRVEVGVPITFDGSGSSGNGPDVADWSWSFGGIAQVHGAQVSHAFAAPGTHSVTLTVRDRDGVTATTTRTVVVVGRDDGGRDDGNGGGGGDGNGGGGGGGGGGDPRPPEDSGGGDPPGGDGPPSGPRAEPDKGRPRLSGVRISSRWQGRGRKAPVRIAFRTSQAASIRITLAREVAGRRVGRRCVAPTRRLLRAKSCPRLLAVPGAMTTRVEQGAAEVRYRSLTPGRYRVTIQATNAAGVRSGTVSAALTISAGRR